MYGYQTPVKSNDVDTNTLQLLTRKNLFYFGLPNIEETFSNYGFSAFGSLSGFDYAVSLTQNSLSNPRVKRKFGNQISGRIGTSVSDIDIGFSVASGAFLESVTLSTLPKSVNEIKHTIIGGDAHYTFRRYEFWGEIMLNSWDAPLLPEKMKATSYFAEVRYQYNRALWLTGRAELFSFGSIDSVGTKTKWGNDASRLEAGIRFRFSTLVLKGVWRSEEHTSEL